MPWVCAPRTSNGYGVVEVRVGGALQREQPDLRAVAVRDDELVLGGERGQRRAPPRRRWRSWTCGVRPLAPLQQGVAAEGDDDAHLSRPAWRPGPP